MAARIAVGGEDFIALRKSDSYYVDKTELLYELVQNTNNAVTLFTRPRRFGKTLTMSMMESFFSVEKRNESGVFDGLDIKKHPAFCAEYMNQYPVLFISLKDAEGLTFDEAFKMLRQSVAGICKKYHKLKNAKKVLPSDAEIFDDLEYERASQDQVKGSLKTLMRMMHAVYGKPVILLIDEYDVPLAKADNQNYYREMLDLIWGFMSTSLKTNEYLKFAVVTGCLRIPKESIFTGVNNFASYSVLDDDFSEYFGFTSDEVDKLLETFDLADKSDVIREWYDGYQFGETQVYCPWDVINYVAALLRRRNAKPKNYWQNTSGNDAIRKFFALPDVNVAEKFETLLNGGTILQTVTDALTYEDAYKNEDNLWSILLMTGYVTLVPGTDVEKDDEEGETEVELRIPNREIAGIFQKAVVEHFKKTADPTKIQNLMTALWNGDEQTATDLLSDLLWNTISYNDYRKDYYHAFLAGIFVGRGGYSVRSNKERGLGRPDIDLRDIPNRRAMIIEAKISESEARMDYWCDSAINQIEKNGYAKGFDGYREVLCYGVAFYKKMALVKKMMNAATYT